MPCKEHTSTATGSATGALTLTTTHVRLRALIFGLSSYEVLQSAKVYRYRPSCRRFKTYECKLSSRMPHPPSLMSPEDLFSAMNQWR